ncbi:MAG TPA: ATP-binding protein [Terriglobales bacterium]|nr:ATP-binding protein [Terriglobales bacterium]
MRSLFLKIFLFFWITVLLIGIAVVVTWSLQPEIVFTRWQALMTEALSTHAQNAAEMMERQGPAAAASYLQRLNRVGRMQTALLDEHGHTILGSPSGEAARVGARAVETGQAVFEMKPHIAYSAQLGVAPSGHHYVLVAEMPRAGPFFAFRATTFTQVLRWVLAILISGLICYLLTLYLTRPILRLRAAAQELATGNLGARATGAMEKRRDELGELVRDFNRMADRIEALLDSQRQLIRDISHELRSPLARLSVALGLARQRAGSEAAPQLDRIEREAERLNDMIGRLLTLARLEGAGTPPEQEPVSLSELVREVAEDAEFEAESRNCRVRVQAATECGTLGCPDLLRSAVENVVRNAVRYTAEGTEIQIDLTCLGSDGGRWAAIRVRDHGPGLPEAELGNVFRPFYRVGKARERETGGTGLGLAITERAIRLHGGTVKAENAPGGGLLVEMRLPASAASQAPANARV